MKENASITKKRRSRKGPNDVADEILARVNHTKASAHAVRVRSILELYLRLEAARAELERLLRQRRDPLLRSAAILAPLYQRFEGEELERPAALVHKTSEELNTLLSRYRWPPMIRAFLTQLKPSFDYFGAEDDSNDDWENEAVLWLLTLTPDGDVPISRFRQCLWCKLLFYPKIRRGKYCSPSHRNEVYNRTPQGRASHANNQARYRENKRRMFEAQDKAAGIAPSGARASGPRSVSKSKSTRNK